MNSFGRILGIGSVALLLVCLHVLPSLAAETPSVLLNLPSGNVIIYEQVTCQVQVTGAVGEGSGTVVFSDGGANGTFPFGDTATLSGGGACSVTYVPGANDAGTTTITVTYFGDGAYDPGSANGPLNVVLRPTETVVNCLTSAGSAGVILVNETGKIEVSVNDLKSGGSDYAPPVPPGTLTIANSLTAGVTVITPSTAFTQGPAGTSTAEYNYTCTSLDLDGDVDTISVTYNPNDGVHASSIGGFGQTVQRRPTVTSLTCTASATGCDCKVTAAEEAGLPGIATAPLGQIIDTTDDSVLVAALIGPESPFAVTSDSIMVLVPVKYVPTDNVHIYSFASDNVTRNNPAWLPSGLLCMDLNVQAILYALNAGVFACDLAGLAMDLAGLLVDVSPDPIAGVGVGVITGATIPSSDIAATAVGIARLAMSSYVLIATTDLDLDGLPGIVEAIMLMSDFDPDNDDDGLSDSTEVDQADGFYSYTATVGIPAWECACPNPKDADSDDDGLNDGDELLTYFTDPCNPDTDGDLISDGEEVGTWASADNRDHADPLSRDTDGDGISDFYEMPLGCLGLPDPRDGFVNSFDSDGDGLRDSLDAYADLPDQVGIAFPGALYVVKVPGSGDDIELLPDSLPSIADEDSDGDGIYDGFEHTRRMDFLDWDGDDDGRCDGHEVLGLGPIPTDPFDDDTDDDGVLDSAELWGTNPTNPVMPDTDGDGLCDGGANTPSGTGTNLLCTCTVGSASGIGDHPNPNGLGEDENGNGSWDVGETDPNRYDTDGDGIGDGIEKLGFSTSRQSMIPATDFFGRPITVTYPACGCLDPLNPDTDGDGLTDGYEDANFNGNFDFLPSDFDYLDPLPGPAMPDPKETNPCDGDTDDDGLDDYAERFQPNPNAFYPFNRTNPLDHDTDNDWMLDGEEVDWECVDPGFDFDPDRDGVDDYYIMGAIGDVLDPTNRDSDSDGIIDGLDPNPCYSDLTPVVGPVEGLPIDSDGDGFADADEAAAATDPEDRFDHPLGFETDLDLDDGTSDRLWLEDPDKDGTADSVVIDIESDMLVDARIGLVIRLDVEVGDFDDDGVEDDTSYTVRYVIGNQRYRHAWIVLTVIDLDSDLEIDSVSLVRE